MQPIFTLNARDVPLLQSVREHENLNESEVLAEIQYHFSSTCNILKSKGIDYSKLRPALVPSSNNNEIGFIFNSKDAKSSWYSRDIMNEIFPYLNPQSTQSFLWGDLLGDDQDMIFQILKKFLVPVRSFTFVHSSSLFCVYINNLSDSGFKRIHEQLRGYIAYIGYFPLTFASAAKIYLSTTLVDAFLKHKQNIIMSNPDDISNIENINSIGIETFEKNNYRIVSIQDIYYDIFLRYKIERPIFNGFETENDMALNSITENIRPLDSLNIIIDESKFNYLKNIKGGKLNKAQIGDLNRDDLSNLIKSKILSNYIYNLNFQNQYNLFQFNLMLEVNRKDSGYPTRLTVGLAYKPDEKVLSLITIF